MRLLNTKDHTFKEFFDTEVPKYAILSHRWVRDQEVSYDDFIGNRRLKTSGYHKILRFCKLARNFGKWYLDPQWPSQRKVKTLEWIWIDTCCIDKRSSAELSEAINSMWLWYSRAEVCFAYLGDVDSKNDLWAQFCASEWFRRGWTLQELLAPDNVLFFDYDFTCFGSRNSDKDLLNYIVSITGIPKEYLINIHPKYASVAQRMSWASNRETTRVEDMAYSLMGIFDVNMPLLYGEGSKAFLRLQQEVLRQSDDESLFAWTVQPDHGRYIDREEESLMSRMFAQSPSEFRGSRSIRVADTRFSPHARPPSSVTNKGVEFYVQLPIDKYPDDVTIADLNHDQGALVIVQLACYCNLPSEKTSSQPSQRDRNLIKPSKQDVFILLAFIESIRRWIRVPTFELLLGPGRVGEAACLYAETFRQIRIWEDVGSYRTRGLEDGVRGWISAGEKVEGRANHYGLEDE